MEKEEKIYKEEQCFDKLADVRHVKSGAVRYDEQRFLTLIHILPEMQRQQVLFYITKLHESYRAFLYYMERLGATCEDLEEFPPDYSRKDVDSLWTNRPLNKDN